MLKWAVAREDRRRRENSTSSIHKRRKLSFLGVKEPKNNDSPKNESPIKKQPIKIELKCQEPIKNVPKNNQPIRADLKYRPQINSDLKSQTLTKILQPITGDQKSEQPIKSEQKSEQPIRDKQKSEQPIRIEPRIKQPIKILDKEPIGGKDEESKSLFYMSLDHLPLAIVKQYEKMLQESEQEPPLKPTIRKTPTKKTLQKVRFKTNSSYASVKKEVGEKCEVKKSEIIKEAVNRSLKTIKNKNEKFDLRPGLPLIKTGHKKENVIFSYQKYPEVDSECSTDSTTSSSCYLEDFQIIRPKNPVILKSNPVLPDKNQKVQNSHISSKSQKIMISSSQNQILGPKSTEISKTIEENKKVVLQQPHDVTDPKFLETPPLLLRPKTRCAKKLSLKRSELKKIEKLRSQTEKLNRFLKKYYHDCLPPLPEDEDWSPEQKSISIFLNELKKSISLWDSGQEFSTSSNSSPEPVKNYEIKNKLCVIEEEKNFSSPELCRREKIKTGQLVLTPIRIVKNSQPRCIDYYDSDNAENLLENEKYADETLLDRTQSPENINFSTSTPIRENFTEAITPTFKNGSDKRAQVSQTELLAKNEKMEILNGNNVINSPESPKISKNCTCAVQNSKNLEAQNEEILIALPNPENFGVLNENQIIRNEALKFATSPDPHYTNIERVQEKISEESPMSLIVKNFEKEESLEKITDFDSILQNHKFSKSSQIDPLISDKNSSLPCEKNEKIGADKNSEILTRPDSNCSSSSSGPLDKIKKLDKNEKILKKEPLGSLLIPEPLYKNIPFEETPTLGRQKENYKNYEKSPPSSLNNSRTQKNFQKIKISPRKNVRRQMMSSPYSGKGEVLVRCYTNGNYVTLHVIRVKNLKASHLSSWKLSLKISLLPQPEVNFTKSSGVLVPKGKTGVAFDQKFSFEPPEPLSKISTNQNSPSVFLTFWKRFGTKSSFLGWASLDLLQKNNTEFWVKLKKRKMSSSMRAPCVNYAPASPPLPSYSGADYYEGEIDKNRPNFPTMLQNSSTMDSGVEDCFGTDEGQGGGRHGIRMRKRDGEGYGFSVYWTSPPRINRVDKRKSADAAGLKVGDLVFSVNGEEILGLDSQTVIAKMKKSGNELTLEVWRSFTPYSASPSPQNVNCGQEQQSYTDSCNGGSEESSTPSPLPSTHSHNVTNSTNNHINNVHNHNGVTSNNLAYANPHKAGISNEFTNNPHYVNPHKSSGISNEFSNSIPYIKSNANSVIHNEFANSPPYVKTNVNSSIHNEFNNGPPYVKSNVNSGIHNEFTSNPPYVKSNKIDIQNEYNNCPSYGNSPPNGNCSYAHPNLGSPNPPSSGYSSSPTAPPSFSPPPRSHAPPVSILKPPPPPVPLSPQTPKVGGASGGQAGGTGSNAWRIRFNVELLESEDELMKDFFICELKYFRKVVAALDRYLIPAQAKSLLTTQELHLSFSHIIKIITITKRILQCVSTSSRSPSWKLGDILLTTHTDHFSDLVSAYSSYAENLGQSSTVLANKMTFKYFAKFVLETTVPKGHFDMTSLLFAPLEHLRNLCEISDEIQHSNPKWQFLASQLKDCYANIVCDNDFMEPISHLSMKKNPLFSVRDLEKRIVSTKFQEFKVSEKGRRWLFGSRLFRKESDGSFAPVWAFLFTDLIVLTTHHVARDRIFFVKESPIKLTDVVTLHFNIPKKNENEFRLLFAPESHSRFDKILPIMSRVKKSQQIVLRTPNLELKSIWKLLLQRQIIDLNTRLSKSSSSNFSISEFCEKFPTSAPVTDETQILSEPSSVPSVTFQNDEKDKKEIIEHHKTVEINKNVKIETQISVHPQPPDLKTETKIIPNNISENNNNKTEEPKTENCEKKTIDENKNSENLRIIQENLKKSQKDFRTETEPSIFAREFPINYSKNNSANNIQNKENESNRAKKLINHKDSPLIGNQRGHRRILYDYKVRRDYPELFGITPLDRRSFIKSIGEILNEEKNETAPYYYISPTPSPFFKQREISNFNSKNYPIAETPPPKPKRSHFPPSKNAPNFSKFAPSNFSKLNNPPSPEESSSNDSGISEEPPCPKPRLRNGLMRGDNLKNGPMREEEPKIGASPLVRRTSFEAKKEVHSSSCSPLFKYEPMRREENVSANSSPLFKYEPMRREENVSANSSPLFKYEPMRSQLFKNEPMRREDKKIEPMGRGGLSRTEVTSSTLPKRLETSDNKGQMETVVGLKVDKATETDEFLSSNLSSQNIKSLNQQRRQAFFSQTPTSSQSTYYSFNQSPSPHRINYTKSLSEDRAGNLSQSANSSPRSYKFISTSFDSNPALFNQSGTCSPSAKNTPKRALQSENREVLKTYSPVHVNQSQPSSSLNFNSTNFSQSEKSSYSNFSPAHNSQLNQNSSSANFNSTNFSNSEKSSYSNFSPAHNSTLNQKSSSSNYNTTNFSQSEKSSHSNFNPPHISQSENSSSNYSPAHLTKLKAKILTNETIYGDKIEYKVLKEEKIAKIERVESSDDSTSSDAASASPVGGTNENGTTDPSWSSSASSLAKDEKIEEEKEREKIENYDHFPQNNEKEAELGACEKEKVAAEKERYIYIKKREKVLEDEKRCNFERGTQPQIVVTKECGDEEEFEIDTSSLGPSYMNRYGTFESLEKIEIIEEGKGIPRSRARFRFDEEEEEDEEMDGIMGEEEEEFFEEEFESDFNFRFPSQIQDNTYNVSRLGPLPPLLEEDFEDEFYDDSLNETREGGSSASNSSHSHHAQNQAMRGDNSYLLSRIATMYARSSISPLKIFRDLWLKKRYRDWALKE